MHIPSKTAWATGLLAVLIALLGTPSTQAQTPVPFDHGDEDEHWSSQFKPPLVRDVHHLAAGTDVVYIAGWFRGGEKLAGRQARVARWSPNRGFELLPQLKNREGNLSAMETAGQILYVAGSFQVGDTVRHVAAFDPRRSAPRAWIPLGEGPGQAVRRLAAVEENLVYAWGGEDMWRWDGSRWSDLPAPGPGELAALAAGKAGLFAALQGEGENRIVRWDGQAWETIGTVNGGVGTLEVQDSTLYVGGRFEERGAQVDLPLAQWKDGQWSAAEGLHKDMTRIRDVVAAGSELHVVGWLVPKEDVAIHRVMRWTEGSWSPLGSGLNKRGTTQIAATEDQVFVGGNFTVAGGNVAYYLAGWDRSQEAWFSPVEDVGQGLPGRVSAIAIGEEDVYVGGDFQVAGEAVARRVAQWDGMQWNALGAGIHGRVRALAFAEGTLYAGGSFDAADGRKVNNVARWDPLQEKWSTLGAGIGGEGGAPFTAVQALETGSWGLVAGGKFIQAGGKAAVGLALWDGSEWQVIGDVYQDEEIGEVRALARAPSGDLYVGGRFEEIGGTAAENIARWDGEKWHALGEGVEGDVRDMALVEDSVYVLGGSGILRWDPQAKAWSALPDPPLVSSDSDCSAIVRALTTSGGALYVGGTYVCPASDSGNPSGRRRESGMPVKWDGTEWTVLGSGVAGSITELASQGSDLYVGGRFRRAGGHLSLNFAHWNAEKVLPVEKVARSSELELSVYPNPARRSAKVSYALPETGQVQLQVYDVLGRRIRTLTRGRLPARRHNMRLEAKTLPNGTYFIRLQSAGQVKTTTLTIAR